MEEYKKQLVYGEKKMETSQSLQEKCRVLYLMGRVKKGREEVMKMIEVVAEEAERVDMEVKYPI